MHTDTTGENTWDFELDTAIPELGGDAAEFVEVTSTEFTDTYYDTENRDLLSHHATVVYAKSDDRRSAWHVTVPLPEGHATREIDAPSTSVPTEVADTLWGLRLGNDLTVAAIIHTRRTRHRYHDSARELMYEVIDDSVSATVTGPVATATRWREVGVTPGPRSSRVPKDVRKRLVGAGARPASASSTFERAVGYAAPRRNDSASPATSAVVGYVHEQIRAIFAGDVALRRGENPVHPVRVAIRRLRSTLRTCAALFDAPGLSTFDDELRWLAGILGEVRDLEVLRARFAAAVADLPDELVLGPVAARIEEELSARQRRHRQGVTETMTSDRYRQLLTTLSAWTASIPLADSRIRRQQLRRIATRSSRKADRRLARAMSTGHDEDLHRARKAAKRARYAGELAAPAVDKSVGRGQAKRYKKIQTILGEHQDAVVAARTLRELGASAGTRDGENGFTYGILYQRELDAAASARTRAFNRGK
ncbi:MULTISPECIES: CHAD domain-containing protein [Gordonia]|uniref:CHAD domain-containing protein n=1 Tax=Gordonia amicalis TaxID=89053 RepID=A0AAE4R3L9_9ACTN|nr:MULTISPECIES: CHAD domain-containing protein [Gordonia]ATD72271.1 CHAD domain-containing protein [Gordonia sp. 1D]MCR8895963.1 CHAD domain-containing protein [Gordonia sp. GONU]MCZ4578643.1 CHAD domain-containing protein [Gordonia amicalis]MCZ4651521.1 CHAD domain-containing protein [Gordonia amicalis]MDJ0452554.1 CHAD domain-containing protein [Gordonia amicalis]